MLSQKNKYSLLLINPMRKYRYCLDLVDLCRVMRRKTVIHPLALPTVAAWTPSHYDIRIIDEHIEPIDNTLKPDIVGITAIAANIKRAYEIADIYRSAGVPVVLGGAQASFNIKESLMHVDSIVVGEAEGAWEECLADFEKNTMRSIYKRSDTYEFETMPRPRWDLIDITKVVALGVQASRGCPYACDFCSVRNLFGKKQRYRKIENLIEEIKALPVRQIAFVDDNLTANHHYARELMKQLKPLGLTWNCQCSIDVCEHPELLKDMAEAGCTSIMLGIESVNSDAIQEAGKFQNHVEKYETSIRRIHENGMHVMGTFIVGFDADKLDAFDNIHEFTLRNNISLPILNILTAYPGTALYERMKSAGRLNAIDQDLLNGVYPTMQFRHMAQSDVFRKYFETFEKMFSYDEVRIKALHIFKSGAFSSFNNAGIGWRDRIFTSSYLLRHFLLTLDSSRRRLLLDLLFLVLQKKVALGHVVKYLLLVISINGYLKFSKEHMTDILIKITDEDPGPLVRDISAAEYQSLEIS